MTYQEAREFIDRSNQYGSKLGLTTITELLRRLGNPQDNLKIIHVAGTNGKGSTTAFISSILASEGYRVGRYISPAVFTYCERVQISYKENDEIVTEYITEQGVAETIQTIKPICEAMLKEGLEHPTSFEIETAMGILYLSQQQVDYAVIEVGLGGRLDATNVFEHPLCCVITSISMDHMQYLGETLAMIATEKAGIIKSGATVVTINSNPEILKVLETVCKQKESSLTIVSKDRVAAVRYSPEQTDFTYQQQEYSIKLLGDFQISNAILAIQAMKELNNLGHRISKEAIIMGLSKAKWSGRFEILATEPYFLIDGAHNEDAAEQLKKALQVYFPKRRLIFIMGVLADKDYERILQITAPLAQIIYTITPDNYRALASTQLAIEAKKYCLGDVVDAGTTAAAITYAYQEATKDDVILAFGSLSYLSEITERLLLR